MKSRTINHFYRKVLTILLLTMSVSGYSQNANADLRNALGNLTFKNPSSSNVYDYLYDMAVHFVPEAYYEPNVTLPSSTTYFFYLYESMYNAHKNMPNSMTSPDDLVQDATAFSNSIPIMLFDYSYLKIKNVALNNSDYFTFNTVTNQLFDHPSPIGDPFEVKEIFAAGVALPEQSNTNCTYRIDPNFLMWGTYHTSKATASVNHQLRIDFGDGTGWHTFDQGIVSNHNVVYAGAGTYTIKVEIYNANSKEVINHSEFERIIHTDIHTTSPDEVWDLPGINLGIYNGCHDGSPENEKIIIYLEGIDPLDMVPSWNRGISQIYSEMIETESLDWLRDYGYTYAVVDWKNSRRDIKENAYSLVYLIDRLKCHFPDSDHEFVIIGESMGGLVARYALTFMETNNYLAGYTVKDYIVDPFIPGLIQTPSLSVIPTCQVDRLHKTRLFLTIDTPHQGANIPLAYQQLYNSILNIKPMGGGIVFPSISWLLFEKYDLFLGSDAAQQMLIYHIDTKTPIGGNNFTFSEHQQKTTFFNDLAQIGNYPNYCKTMALSNGSIAGKKQTTPYNGMERVANDVLFQFGAKIHGRVFGITVPIINTELELNSNPNGNGQIFDFKVDLYSLNIDFYWFGVNINWMPNTVISSNVNAVGVKPWCTESGGIYGGGFSIGVTQKSNNFNIGIFSYSSSNSNGLYTLSANAGIPWLAQTGVSALLYSNGMHFNFIPTTSALDWGNLNTNSPISPNLESMNVGSIMNNTAFDVVSGISGGNIYSNSSKYNRGHLNVENPGFENAFEVNLEGECAYLGRILNREIGEDVLYLNNRNLAWHAKFEAKTHIYLNGGANNPHYEYEYSTALPSIIPTNLANTGGFYSKENTFVSLGQNPLTGTPFNSTIFNAWNFIDNYDEPIEYVHQGHGIQVCCYTIKSAEKNEEPTPSEKIAVENFDSSDFMAVSPNPFTDNFTINYRIKESGKYTLCIYNISGQKIFNQIIEPSGTNQSLSIAPNISNGLYFVSMVDRSGKSILYQKVVKQ